MFCRMNPCRVCVGKSHTISTNLATHPDHSLKSRKIFSLNQVRDERSNLVPKRACWKHTQHQGKSGADDIGWMLMDQLGGQRNIADATECIDGEE